MGLKIAIIVGGILLTVIFVVALTICFLDVLLTRLRQKRTVVERQIEREPEPEIIPEPVIVVPEIDAETADELISDEVAETFIDYEDVDVAEGYRSYVNIGILDMNFEAGETVSLEVLKEKKLIPAKTKRIKILAEGRLTKALDVKAHAFSIQAVKMIKLTGGNIVKLKQKA